MTNTIRGALESGIATLGFDAAPSLVDQLMQFIELLVKWNKVYNLTAVRDPQQMVPVHLLDSLSVNGWLEGSRIVDVGTGAGLPGIPLALCNAEKQFTLLDSNGKKTRFVTHAAGVLGLINVDVVQARSQDYAPETLFDTVICRAFAPLPRIVATAGHLCGSGGSIVAMKGGRPQEELVELPPDWRVGDVQRIVVPGLDSERHLLRLVKN